MEEVTEDTLLLKKINEERIEGIIQDVEGDMELDEFVSYEENLKVKYVKSF